MRIALLILMFAFVFQCFSWDRPPRMMYYFSGNIGCEITVVKGLFYITPEVNFSLLNKMGYTADDNMNIIEITRRYFLPSCGVDFKFRL